MSRSAWVVWAAMVALAVTLVVVRNGGEPTAAGEPMLPDLPIDDTMFVSKHLLGRIMGCEKRFLAEDDDKFEWSVPLARGTIAHKAIELSIHWRREPEPLVLVDESIARLSEGIAPTDMCF